jgi:hypothetical protein
MKNNELLANAVRHEPWVWLRRLVIVENSNPKTNPIQDITFTRGLNIIWAQEPDDDDASAEISGHSAGKTSLCRLIRYLLGEKQFATKNNTRLIGKAFPEGYAGGEIIVGTKHWAVIRPLKKGRTSYVKLNATVEEVLEDRSSAAYENDYPDKIGLTALLNELGSGRIIETDQEIKWEHLLAWCTRDQEMRFQDVYGWRSPRSESEWPAFQQPKADALFLMRVALGLFLPQELKKEESLGKLKRGLEQLEKKIAELEKEPEFRVNLYDRELRDRLQTLLPDKTGVRELPLKSADGLGLFPDLDNTTKEAATKLEIAIAEITNDHNATQATIDDLGGQIRELESKQLALASVLALDAKAQTQISGDPAERDKIRKALETAANATCEFGNVLFRECSYVKNRREGLKATEIQDAHAAEQNEARRMENIAKVEKQKEEIAEKIKGLKRSLETKQRARDGYLASLREKRDELRDLRQSLASLHFWIEKKSKPDEFKELTDTRKALEKQGEAIGDTERELNELLQEHNTNQQNLASIFSTAVKKVLPSGTYDGKVLMNDRQLSFSITHGASMSGEAVETLAVLLSDICGLIYNAKSEKSRLPGFLLHDSPREADLGKRIYWSFLRFAASLQAGLESLDQCPFQYILTTTTEPPKELQTPDWIKLQLSASKASELLFKRSLADGGDGEAEESLLQE